MLWKLEKKFASSVLQEVLIVTISERMFKGGRIWQRQRQPSIIISSFFSRKTKSNFHFPLLWKLLRTFFFPKTILFSKHFAWSVLSLVVFKTSISCAMPCWTVLPLRHLKDDFASTQRVDASCLCWHFLSSCLYSQPCHESSCCQTAAMQCGECCRCETNAMLDSVAIATSADSFLTLNTCK